MTGGPREPSIVVSVGEFAARLREVFRRIRPFEYLGITGEISQWNPRQNGVYFTIKDANAVLECFAYQNRAQRFPPVALGTAVIAYGSVRVVERRSRYELLVEDLALTGIGALYQEYEALKERFRLEGLFAPERKRRLPRFPRRIVLVSAKGKGAEDFEKTMRERASHVCVDFIETRVQGINAETEIADAMDRASGLRPDLVVLARGGGSYEDLFTFNREAVVRAILRSAVPVITGIGHTGDHHLADDVADLACETPSNAAHLIANLWQRGNERLERLAMQLDREMRDLLARALQRGDLAHEGLQRAWERYAMRGREGFAMLERRLSARNPAALMSQTLGRLAESNTRLDALSARLLLARRSRLDTLGERLHRAWDQRAQGMRHRMDVTRTGLHALDPAGPLARGYAMIFRDGLVVRSAADVAAGDAITAHLGHGTIAARVEAVRDE